MSDESKPLDAADVEWRPVMHSGWVQPTYQRIPTYSAGDIGAMMFVATICLSVLITVFGIWFG